MTPMPTTDALDRGRASFRQQSWSAAFAELSAADHEAPLQPRDLELLAAAAYLLGRENEGAEHLVRAHREHLGRSNPPGAARCAIWLALQLLLKGEIAQAGGWLARAHDLLGDGLPDCVERGFLLVPAGLESLDQGDVGAARTTFELAAEIGDRFGDRDLSTLARLGIGQSLIAAGAIAEAAVRLDGVMVAVTAGEVSAVTAGIVFCAGIEASLDAFDLRRAREWTAALTRWCATQPDLVPYRGQCLVHRSQIMQMHGAWPDAMDAAQDACIRLSEPLGQPAVGAAFYQQAELHRLRGEFAQAEETYRRASRWVRDPQPGLALLLLMQGQVDAAAAAIRRAVDEADGRTHRSRLLGASVEILLAVGDLGAARADAEELQEIADHFGAAWLRAMAGQSIGAVLVAEQDGRAAVDALRRSWTTWQELDAPYEAARVRVLMGLACRDLGDEHSAEMELDAARWIFTQLGALPDVARVEALSRIAGPATGGLTARETQVLRLVATGRTNRALAGELFLSEKTIARHLSNIFTKLRVTSRSAATAYAYEHGLVRPD